MSASPPASSARWGREFQYTSFSIPPIWIFFACGADLWCSVYPQNFSAFIFCWEHFSIPSKRFQYTLFQYTPRIISVYPQDFSILPNHFSIPCQIISVYPHFSIPCQIISVSPQDFIPRNHFSIPSKRFQYNLRNHFRRVYWNLGRYTEIISQGILKSWKVYWNDLAGYTEIGRYTRNYFAEIYS